MKRTVFVVGYPKSGNTWLCRLVGEALNAPVVGYLNGAGLDVGDVSAQAGSEVDFQVVKSHMLFDDLRAGVHDLVVQVVRDPRDVMISLMHYYKLGNSRDDEIDGILVSCKWWERVLLCGTEKGLRLAYASMVYGNGKLAYSLHKSYSLFRSDWEETAMINVRYEDLLDDAHLSQRAMFSSLNIPVSEVSIKRSVAKNKFSASKQEYKLKGDHLRYSFMRSGKAGVWKNELSFGMRLLCLIRWSSFLHGRRF